jgi:hypothetical protein
MSEKIKSDENTCIHSGKKGHIIAMEIKVEIIKQHEKGNMFVNIASAYEMNESTLRNIIKDKVRILQHVKSSVPMQSTTISKKRSILIEEMENLLVIWIEDL